MAESTRLPLSSESEYTVARAEWERFFSDSLHDLRLTRNWVDWVNTSYTNLMPADDSFVILSKKCSDEAVGFSLHLCLPEAGIPNVGSCWRVMGEGILDEPIRHFVITSEADCASVVHARSILLGWLKENEKTT